MKLAVGGGAFCCVKRPVGLSGDVELYSCFSFCPVVDELHADAVDDGIENLRRLWIC